MPRVFVNGLANFAIQGGMVSFTLQDQPPRGQPGRVEPEDVVSVMMREADFAQMLQVLGQHLAAYQARAGARPPTPPQGGGAAGGQAGPRTGLPIGREAAFQTGAQSGTASGGASGPGAAGTPPAVPPAAAVGAQSRPTREAGPPAAAAPILKIRPKRP